MLEQESPVKLTAMRGKETTWRNHLHPALLRSRAKFQNPTSVDLHRLNVDDSETTRPTKQVSTGSASMLESLFNSLTTPVSNTDARTPKYTTLYGHSGSLLVRRGPCQAPLLHDNRILVRLRPPCSPSAVWMSSLPTSLVSSGLDLVPGMLQTSPADPGRTTTRSSQRRYLRTACLPARR